MDSPTRREFDSVDRTTDPDDFIRYLDKTRSTDFIQRIKRLKLTLMDLRSGESAADIGCGTGEDACALASLVGPRGYAVGLDLSSNMIATARQRADDGKMNVTFVQADAHELPFADASFDAVTAERLLQHTPDADTALREIVRVAKPGGRIVIWESDLDLFVIDAPDYEASRVMQRFICDGFRNGDIGHRLYRRFLEFGLVDVQSIPLIGHFTDFALMESAFDLSASVERATAEKRLDAHRARPWLESLRSAARSGRFSASVGGFAVFGRKA
jgi:ubiquinone/menaquinone biosynthesis C-methylase UbiE